MFSSFLFFIIEFDLKDKFSVEWQFQWFGSLRWKDGWDALSEYWRKLENFPGLLAIIWPNFFPSILFYSTSEKIDFSRRKYEKKEHSKTFLSLKARLWVEVFVQLFINRSLRNVYKTNIKYDFTLNGDPYWKR